MPFQFKELSIPPQCAGGLIGSRGSNINELIQQVLTKHPGCRIRMKVNGSGRNTNVTISCLDNNSNAIPYASDLISRDVLRIQDEAKVRAQNKRQWRSRQVRKPRTSQRATAATTVTTHRGRFDALDFSDDDTPTEETEATPAKVKRSVGQDKLGFNYGGISDLRRQHRSDAVSKRKMEIQGGDVVDGVFQPRKLTWNEFHKEKPAVTTTKPKEVESKPIPKTNSSQEFPSISTTTAAEPVWNIQPNLTVETNCSWDDTIPKKRSWADMADSEDEKDEN